MVETLIREAMKIQEVSSWLLLTKQGVPSFTDFSLGIYGVKSWGSTKNHLKSWK